MSVHPETLSAVLSAMQARRHRDEAALQERRLKLYEAVPGLRETDRDLMAAVARLVRQPGREPEPDAGAASDGYQRLRKKRQTLLLSSGYAADALDPIVYCPVCEDTGIAGGATCGCVLAQCGKEEKKRLSYLLDLHNQSFAAFNLGYYSDKPGPDGISPRENAEANLTFCRGYAENFNSDAANVLMIGNPGLGKTFLSAAIAGETAAAGYSVVYDSVVTVIAAMEREKFDREDTDGGSDRYFNCDLLILDDLGTEMHTPFSQSALYTLVNQRLTSSRPTIINTNLNMTDLTARYQPALVSRIRGLFHPLYFTGEDIRLLAKRG